MPALNLFSLVALVTTALATTTLVTAAAAAAPRSGLNNCNMGELESYDGGAIWAAPNNASLAGNIDLPKGVFYLWTITPAPQGHKFLSIFKTRYLTNLAGKIVLLPQPSENAWVDLESVAGKPNQTLVKFAKSGLYLDAGKRSTPRVEASARALRKTEGSFTFSHCLKI